MREYLALVNPNATSLVEQTIWIWLVVWNMIFFSIQLGTIIPTDELHHFSEG